VVAERSAAEARPAALSLTTVVMAYNEAENLRATVEELVVALEGLAVPYELLIVDDGSSDSTGSVADSLAQEYPRARVLHHESNRGLGGVYRSGFAESRGRLVTFFPADGQFPATIIPEFFEAAAEADLVLGYIPDRRGSLLARVLSWGERCLYRLLFGPIPKFQGIMMFHRHILEEVQLQSEGRGWAIVMEFIVRCARSGYRIANRATTIRPRRSGESKVNNLRTIHANLRQTIALKRYL
jgi:glycosyltransferase involved in cell wall biosynthesis